MNPKKAGTLTRVSVWFATVSSALTLAVSASQASLTPPDSMQGLDRDHRIFIPEVVQHARSDERARFQAAEKALREGNYKRYQLLSETLQDYPLYPYLELYELQRRLFSATADEMDALQSRYSDIPRARWLHQQWMMHLGSSGNWEELREASDGQSGNERLRCLSLRAHLDGGDHDRVMKAMPGLWRTGASLPQACDPLLDYWRENDGLTADLAWERMLLALDAENTGLASYLRRYLPSDYREHGIALKNVHRQPQRLRRVQDFNEDNERMRDLVAHGMSRYARRSPQGAVEIWPHYRAIFDFSDEQRLAVERNLGLMLAVKYDQNATRWLRAAAELDDDRALYEWQVRVHLRHRDWEGVLEALDTMPQELESSSRWRYWRARALDQLGEPALAETLFAEVADSRNFYGFMAADRLGAPYQLNNQGHSFSNDDVADITRMPAIQRAYELYQLGRMGHARQEWQRAMHDLEPEAVLVASRLAQSWGWYEQGVNGAIAAQAWDHLDMRFPLPYRQHFHQAANEKALDVNWVYALARQESAFNSNARSHKGAMGLLQLLPTTARETASQLGLGFEGNAQLYEPAYNIRLGSAHLSELLETFDNNRILATAAYNAGSHRVKRWLEDGARDLDSDIWVETMPFYETRQYVQNVMAYTVIYGFRRGEPPGHLLTERELACMCLEQQ